MKDDKDPKDKPEVPPVDTGKPFPSPAGSTEGPGAPAPADPTTDPLPDPLPPGSTEGPGK